MKCPACDTKISIPPEKKAKVFKERAGTFIKVRCPNTECRHVFRYKVPKVNPEEALATHIRVKSNLTLGKLTLQVVPNDKTKAQTLTFPADQDAITLGRLSSHPNAARADLPIATRDTYMSKIHCRIERQGDGAFILKDAQSKNGTFFNGAEERMDAEEELFLEQEDYFRIGRTTIEVHLDNTTKDTILE